MLLSPSNLFSTQEDFFSFFDTNSFEGLSSFFPLEMEPGNTQSMIEAGGVHSNENDRSNDENKKKKKKVLAELPSSLLTSEEGEKAEIEEMKTESQQEKILLESNHKRKKEAQFQSGLHLDLEESGGVRIKRAKVAAAAADSPGAATTHHRRLWVKDRSRAWWDMCNHPDYPEEEFRRAFRMGRETFDMICDELGSVVAKEDTMLRAAIPVRQRVAACIWRLATGEPLRLVSKRFGLGISTCHKIVLEVCAAIKTVLMPKYLQWPGDDAAVGRVKAEFEAISGIPNVVGSMYTTHIPIIAPKVSVTAYLNKRQTERNQKTSYSTTVQGVVDTRGLFTDVCIGWPGSMSDEQILEKSALYQRGISKLLNGVWIAGNANFPLLDWVLVPYTHQHLTWTQHAFNEKIGDVHRISRDAFARLKGRWCCLQKRAEVKLQDLPVVLGTCCVLHNICELRGEKMDPELHFELNDDEMVPENLLRSINSIQARDKIAHNLLHRGLAGTAFL